jgi:hypothetical protein
MPIETRDKYEKWVSQQVVPLFEKAGIDITPNARNLLVYTLQSHIDEKSMASDEALLKRAERFCNFAVEMYRRKCGYGKREMNFNRAMHLIVALTCA